MSLYQRAGSPNWYYSFTLDGVRFRGSTGCTARAQALQVEAEARHRAKAQRRRKDPWRLRDCFGAYWVEHAKFARDFAAIEAKLDALSRLLGKNTLISELTNADLMDYRAARQREGLQAHSVNRDFAYLKAALRHAHQMHGQEVAPIAWKAIKAKEPPHRIRFLSRDEYARLLAVCDDGLAKIVKLAVATGLRKTNLLQLEWQQVDLASGLVTVKLKGNKIGRVKLTPASKAALVAGVEDRRGRVFETKNFRKRWEKAVADAKLEDFRFHDLRHTFASWARMAGADIADICEAMHHSSVSVTMRYAHIEPEEHTTAFDRISQQVWSHSASQSGQKRRNSAKISKN